MQSFLGFFFVVRFFLFFCLVYSLGLLGLGFMFEALGLKHEVVKRWENSAGCNLPSACAGSLLLQQPGHPHVLLLWGVWTRVRLTGK